MISRAALYLAGQRQARAFESCKSSLFLLLGRKGRLCEVRGSVFREALGSMFLDLLLWIHGARWKDVYSWDEVKEEKILRVLRMLDVTAGREG